MNFDERDVNRVRWIAELVRVIAAAVAGFFGGTF